MATHQITNANIVRDSPYF